MIRVLLLDGIARRTWGSPGSGIGLIGTCMWLGEKLILPSIKSRRP